MPAAQTAMGPLNQRFAAGSVADRKLNPPEAFGPGMQLADLVEDEPHVDREFVRAFIASMPRAIHEAIRAVIHQNLEADEPLPITFAWLPGYDWELTISDVADTDRTRGGITVVLRSRYPDDPHPLDGDEKGD